MYLTLWITSFISSILKIRKIAVLRAWSKQATCDIFKLCTAFNILDPQSVTIEHIFQSGIS